MTDFTADVVRDLIAQNGSVVSLGQFAGDAERWLKAEVRAGRLTKYRGFWNTRSARFGIGPLKTIYATHAFAEAAGA